VRAKYSSMPLSRTDGYLVYEGSLNSVSDTSMDFDENPGTIYYRLWAQNEDGYWFDNEVNETALESPVLKLIAYIFLSLCITFLALWKKELFLYIVSFIGLIFLSLEIIDISVYMAIPVWILSLYMVFKSVMYFI